MKAMILAAGRGSRLRPLTDTVPKPMIPIAGLPLLEHTLRLLRSHGFDDLIINLHHLPEVIRQYFGNGDRLGVRLRYADEPQLRGTAGAIRDVATLAFSAMKSSSCSTATISSMQTSPHSGRVI